MTASINKPETITTGRTRRKLAWLAIIALVVVVVAASAMVAATFYGRSLLGEEFNDRGYLAKGVVAREVVRAESNWRCA